MGVCGWTRVVVGEDSSPVLSRRDFLFLTDDDDERDQPNLGLWTTGAAGDQHDQPTNRLTT
jgi:hypothetical protein